MNDYALIRSFAMFKDGIKPNPNKIYPIQGYDNEIYVKPTIKHKNVIVGDFTYIADKDFESHVTHHYDFNDDKLMIGKFCQIGKGVEFVMNGANHKMNCISTYPFFTLEGWNAETPKKIEMPIKGDTIVGNDVWIGEDVTVLPGVHIGDGAIIGKKAVVGSDVPPYSIAVGSPAKVVKKRFDDELITLLLDLKWWDRPIEEINDMIPLLTSNDIEMVKNELKRRL